MRRTAHFRIGWQELGKVVKRKCNITVGRFENAFSEKTEEQFFSYVKVLRGKLCRFQGRVLAQDVTEVVHASCRMHNEKKSPRKYFHWRLLSTHPQLCLQNAESVSLKTAAF
jgi:hypothetical protein